MQNSQIKTNYVFNLIYQLFLLITPLITAPYVSRVLTSEGVGQYSFTLSIVTYFTIFATFGFTYYGQRSIAQNQKSKEERSVVFWEIFTLKLITSLISSVLFFVLIKTNVLESYNTLLIIQIINILSIALDATFLLQGLEQFKKIVFPNLIIKSLSIVSIFVFVKDIGDLNLYIVIHSLSILATSIVTLLFSKKFIKFVKFKKINVKRHFVPALKLFIPTIAISIYAILDKTLIGLISNDSNVGFYEQSEKIVKMVLTIVTSLSAVMIPNNAKLFAEKKHDEVNTNIEKAFSFSLFIGMPLMFGLIAVSPNFVPWFFGPGYESCVGLIQILSILIFAIGLNNVLGVQYLVPTNKEKIFTISVIIGAVTNFILNIITIKYFGAFGAAISTIIAETVILIYQMIYLRKTFKFFKLFDKCKIIFVSSIIMFVVVYILSKTLVASIINTLLLVLMGGFVYVFLLLLFREKMLINFIKTLKNNKIINKFLSFIKKAFRKIFGKTNIYCKLAEIKRQKKNKCIEGSLFKNILKFKIIDFRNYRNYHKVKYEKIEGDNFYYFIDKKFAIKKKKGEILLENIAIDYSIVLENSIQDLLVKYPQNRFVQLLKQEVFRIKPVLNKNQEGLFDDFYNKKCSSFAGALQRILFVNQVCWQTGHRLIGLGRLDKLLDPYYNNDIKTKNFSIDNAKELLKEFFVLLNKDYSFKSNTLLGDVGQIIILGGLEPNGDYFESDLTSIILKVLTSLNLPDPKALLRVSKKTSKKLLSLAIDCISKGTGSPLLSNDDVVIKSMVDFGYDLEDACDYATSACWEVLPQKNAAETNNFSNLNYIKVLNETLKNKNFCDINALLKDFEKNIVKELEFIIGRYKSTYYAQDPVMSFLKNNNKNINTLDTKYNCLGILSVGISNSVNAILNINKYVFEEKKYSIAQMFDKLTDDTFINSLKFQNVKFGNDDEEVIDLTKRIMKMATDYLKNYNLKNSLKVKIGYSSPSYMDHGKISKASLDGRKDFEPLNVHISASSPLAYTELINFACQLDYSQPCINGNVIDFSISPQIINEQREKVQILIKTAIEMGFYQMQINVISCDQLIEAKANPEKFPNLIVRVWGFSAYFNDLSDDYKNLLIERARNYESAN